MTDQNKNTNHKVGLWISNLMDRIKVENSLKNRGFEAETISDLQMCYEFLKANSNNIVVIDLMDSSVKLEMVHEQFSDSPDLTERIIGYFPHVQIQIKKEAQQCGIKHIYPRSMFFSDSAGLIQRIIDEE